jgi:hypothetical protein
MSVLHLDVLVRLRAKIPGVIRPAHAPAPDDIRAMKYLGAGLNKVLPDPSFTQSQRNTYSFCKMLLACAFVPQKAWNGPRKRCCLFTGYSGYWLNPTNEMQRKILLDLSGRGRQTTERNTHVKFVRVVPGPYSYVQVTELDDAEQLVRTLLLCWMSKIVAPDGPTVLPDDLVATALENVTVPKLANGTRPPFDSKSSTIHSASYSQSAGWPENVCVTDVPLVLFLIVAVPPVLEDALTVTVTESPALKLMPEKS